MAKESKVSTLFDQMPKLNPADLKSKTNVIVEKEPVVVKEQLPQKEVIKVSEPEEKKEYKKPAPKKDVKEKKVELPLRKDGKPDNRFSERKQDKRYQVTLPQDMFDALNELAFSKSSAKNKVSVNSLVIEALDDLLKKNKVKY